MEVALFLARGLVRASADSPVLIASDPTWDLAGEFGEPAVDLNQQTVASRLCATPGWPKVSNFAATTFPFPPHRLRADSSSRRDPRHILK
jgi:hypothetical protein